MNFRLTSVTNRIHVDQSKDKLLLKNGWHSRNTTKIELKKKVRRSKRFLFVLDVFHLVYESVRLRESIFHTMGQSSADLESQSKASEYALRKRLHEMERAFRELEWQKKQVMNTIFFSRSIDFVIFLFRRPKKKFSAMKTISNVWRKAFEVKGKYFLLH